MKPATYVIRDQDRLERAIAFLRKLPLDKRPWEMVVKPYVKKRSGSQNNLYHAWVQILADAIGYTHEEMHDELRRQLLPPVVRVNRWTGEEKEFPKSTTELSTVEFRDYLEKIEILAAEQGIMLPHPNDPDAWDQAHNTGGDDEAESGADASAHQPAPGKGRRGRGTDRRGPQAHRRSADRPAGRPVLDEGELRGAA